MADGQPSDSATVHLAWLMWCYHEGYVKAEDRAILTNWLLEDPATMHPDDVVERLDLLAMADEVLADAAARSDVQEGHAGTTTEHEVASAPPSGQQAGPTEQADLQGEPSASHRPPEVVALTPDDGEAYYRSALQWLRQAATIHYIGDAFDPEHMRELANLATAALRGDPITDYDAATERGRQEGRRLMELFSDVE